MSHYNLPVEDWTLITEWSTLYNYPGIGSGKIYSTTREHSPFGIRMFIDNQGDLWQVRLASNGEYVKVPMQGYTLAFRECNDKEYYYVISKDPNN
jgi:hypothetical protein